MGDRVRATLQGYWGFEKYNAPSFELVNVPQSVLGLAAPDEGALIVGVTRLFASRPATSLVSTACC